jgi:hypothetical protein
LEASKTKPPADGALELLKFEATGATTDPAKLKLAGGVGKAGPFSAVFSPVLAG